MRRRILSLLEGERSIAKQYLDAAIADRNSALAAYAYRLRLFVGTVGDCDRRESAYGTT